jgi:hypothetical protein
VACAVRQEFSGGEPASSRAAGTLLHALSGSNAGLAACSTASPAHLATKPGMPTCRATTLLTGAFVPSARSCLLRPGTASGLRHARPHNLSIYD